MRFYKRPPIKPHTAHNERTGLSIPNCLTRTHKERGASLPPSLLLSDRSVAILRPLNQAAIACLVEHPIMDGV